MLEGPGAVQGLRENSSVGLAQGLRVGGWEERWSSRLGTEQKPIWLPASLCFCDLIALSGGLLCGGPLLTLATEV